MRRISIYIFIYILLAFACWHCTSLYTSHQLHVYVENIERGLYHFIDMYEYFFAQIITQSISPDEFYSFLKSRNKSFYELIVYDPHKELVFTSQHLNHTLTSSEIQKNVIQKLYVPLRIYTYEFYIDDRMYISSIYKIEIDDEIYHICLISDQTDFYTQWKQWRIVYWIASLLFLAFIFISVYMFFHFPREAVETSKTTSLDQYYDDLIINQQALICVLNNAYEVEKISPRLLNILKYDVNEVIGHHLSRFMKDFNLSQITFLALTEGVNTAKEICLVDNVGEEHHFLTTVFHNYNEEENALSRLMIILQPIDNIRETEHRLRYELYKNEFHKKLFQMILRYNDLHSIIEFILEETHKIIVYDFARLLMVQGDELICYYSNDPDLQNRETPLTIKIGEGLGGLVAKIKRGMIVNDASRSHITYSISDTENIDECLVACPMVVKNSVIGVMQLTRESLNYFTDEDLHLLETIVDLTTAIFDKTRLETELIESQKQVYTILNESALGVVILKGHKILFANKMFCDFIDFETNELIDKDITDYLDVKNKSILISQLTTYLPEYVATTDTVDIEEMEWKPSLIGKKSTLTQIEFNTSTGLKVYLELSLSAFEWHSQRCTLITANNITDKVEVNKLLLQSQKLESVGALASGISHDFKNILASIMGAADLIMLKTDEQSPAYSYAKTIKTSASRGAGLSQQLLNFSSNRLLELETVNLNDILRETIQIITYTFNKNIKIDFDLTIDPLYFEGDVVKVQQCILNLCVNARDAMPDGGILTIKTRLFDDVADTKKIWSEAEEKAYSFIEISDTGCGIHQNDIHKIFKSFFTTKEKNKGTGLGLATTKQIINEFKGNILVESELNVGTSFYIFLPWIKAEKRQIEETTDDINMGNHIILLCDDEQIVLEVAKELFEELGCEVYAADNGYEALEILKAHPEITSAVIDRIMPKMDGFSLLKQIKELRPDMKVVFASGFIQESEQEEIKALGAFDFLIKPFRLEELIKLLGKL